MIVLDVVPGTTAWAEARIGIPTASCFDRILTPSKLEFSKQATAYALELIAEQLIGAPLDQATSGFMDRGSAMEREAIGWYDLVKDVDSTPAGFVLRDDRSAGCTPDRFVGTDGLLEIKCPSATAHLTYLLNDQGIGADYRLQTQGQLWVCEREWNDTLSYHPTIPKALVRQYRDETVIAAIAASVARFRELMYELQRKLQVHGLFETIEAPRLEVARGGA